MADEPSPIQIQAGRARAPSMRMYHSVRAYEWAIDDVAPHVSDAAHKVLLYLLRRTMGYRKESEFINRSEVAAATGKAERTVSRLVAELASSGHVVIDFNGGGNRYTMRIPKLNIPKRLDKDRQKTSPGWGDSLATSGNPDEDSIARSGKAALPEVARVLTKEEVYRNTSVDRTAKDSAATRRTAVATTPESGDPTRNHAAARAAAAKKTEKARTPDRRSNAPAELFRTWVLAHYDIDRHHPMEWGGKKNNVGGVVKQFSGEPEDLHAFLRWVVENWNGAVRDKLQFIKNWPDEPRIWMVDRFMPDLIDASRSSTAAAPYSGPHMKEIARLNRLGKYEQAAELMRRG